MYPEHLMYVCVHGSTPELRKKTLKSTKSAKLIKSPNPLPRTYVDILFQSIYTLFFFVKLCFAENCYENYVF